MLKNYIIFCVLRVEDKIKIKVVAEFGFVLMRRFPRVRNFFLSCLIVVSNLYRLLIKVICLYSMWTALFVNSVARTKKDVCVAGLLIKKLLVIPDSYSAEMRIITQPLNFLLVALSSLSSSPIL